MKPTLFAAALILALAGSCPAEPQAKKRGGWINLFDGRSLSGWVDGAGKPARNEKWRTTDGVLHLTGKGGGNLYSARDFGDFDLSFEWKIEAGGNSGVKYRMAKYGKSLLGPEYQLLDDRKNPTGKGATGGLYDIVAPDEETKKVLPVGQWNRSRIVVQGGHIQHFLNGRKVVDVTVGSPEWKEAVAASKFKENEGFAENAAGSIMLQDHGNPVWFRKVRIREL